MSKGQVVGENSDMQKKEWDVGLVAYVVDPPRPASTPPEEIFPLAMWHCVAAFDYL
ncbi:MAG: hypothetical protein AAFV85_28370 [Cyanobacteria bacterium J06634_6]